MGMQAARGAMAGECRRPRRNGYFFLARLSSSSSHSLPARSRGEKGRHGAELALLAELRPPAPGLRRGERGRGAGPASPGGRPQPLPAPASPQRALVLLPGRGKGRGLAAAAAGSPRS